jgi:hypothetical protein
MNMLGWALLFGAGLSVATGHPALECESLKTSDDRAFCRAITSGDQIYCETIHDEGRRQLCRAETRR